MCILFFFSLYPGSVRWSHRSSSWSGGAAATWMLCPTPVRSCSLLCHAKDLLRHREVHLLRTTPPRELCPPPSLQPPHPPHAHTPTRPQPPPALTLFPLPPLLPLPLLKNDHCASQLNEQRVTRKQDLAPCFNWMRAPIPGAESTDAITGVWFCTVVFFSLPGETSEAFFILSYSAFQFPVDRNDEAFARSRGGGGVLKCVWVNSAEFWQPRSGEQLVGRAGAGACRQIRDRQTDRQHTLHRSLQFPCGRHVMNADRLFGIGCDSPVSFRGGVTEQTAMHTQAPLLVSYQQVLMLL